MQEMKQVWKMSDMNPGRLIPLLCIVIAMAGCDRDRKNPGWDYFPDMFYSNAYETNSPSEVFPDGKTMQAPVEGTVSRESLPFMYGPSVEERGRAGRELTNPLDPTEENIRRGGKVYGIFCMDCHGEKGDGQGYLVTSGLYNYPVRSLLSDEAKDLPDGAIYHTVTLGFGVMGAYGPMIRPDDRWKAIIYLRKELQGTDN